MKKFLFPILIIGFLGLSSAATYDLDSLYYDQQFDISNEASTDSTGFAWNNDGSNFFVTDADDRVYEYTVSTPYDISTASYNQVSSFDDVSDDLSHVLESIEWNDDGSKMYLLQSSDFSTPEDKVFEYTLSTPYDISTASYNDQKTVDSDSSDTMTSIEWSDTGDKMFLLDDDTTSVHEYTASTSFDLSSTTDQGFYTVDSTEAHSLSWKPDGTKLFVGGDTTLHQYDVSSSYDPSTLVSEKSLGVGDNLGRVEGFDWNNNGSDAYFNSDGGIYQYGQNAPPNSPNLVNPSDGGSNIGVSPTLQVDVTDDNSDSMDVSFYDASDDSLLGTDTGVADGGTAEYTWSNLDYGTSYSWYAVADDGSTTTQSSTWSFETTHIEDVSNTEAHTGSFWIENSAMRWVSGGVERVLRNINVVDASSSAPIGSVWIEGDSLHLINENSEELSYSGPVIDASTDAPNGYTWIENDLIHYVDQSGDERVINGE